MVSDIRFLVISSHMTLTLSQRLSLQGEGWVLALDNLAGGIGRRLTVGILMDVVPAMPKKDTHNHAHNRLVLDARSVSYDYHGLKS
jgi:hypothetical protein